MNNKCIYFSSLIEVWYTQNWCCNFIWILYVNSWKVVFYPYPKINWTDLLYIDRKTFGLSCRSSQEIYWRDARGMCCCLCCRRWTHRILKLTVDKNSRTHFIWYVLCSAAVCTFHQQYEIKNGHHCIYLSWFVMVYFVNKETQPGHQTAPSLSYRDFPLLPWTL